MVQGHAEDHLSYLTRLKLINAELERIHTLENNRNFKSCITISGEPPDDVLLVDLGHDFLDLLGHGIHTHHSHIYR